MKILFALVLVYAVLMSVFFLETLYYMVKFKDLTIECVHVIEKMNKVENTIVCPSTNDICL